MLKDQAKAMRKIILWHVEWHIAFQPKITEVMGSNTLEDTWNFSGAHETIADIAQQVRGSFLQLITSSSNFDKT